MIAPLLVAAVVAARGRRRRARRLDVQLRGARPEVRAAGSRRPASSACSAWTGSPSSPRLSRSSRVVAVAAGFVLAAARARSPRARHVHARGGARPRRVARGGEPRGLCRDARADRGRGRAVPVLAAPPPTADDQAGGARKSRRRRKAGPRCVRASAVCSGRSRTRRMMADVPKADVVAMNPTHYAVALRYDAGQHEGAARRREGRGPRRVQHPPRRRGAQRADLRASAVRACAVPHERDRRRRSRRGCTSRWRKCSPTSISSRAKAPRRVSARRARREAAAEARARDRRRSCSSRTAAAPRSARLMHDGRGAHATGSSTSAASASACRCS